MKVKIRRFHMRTSIQKGWSLNTIKSWTNRIRMCLLPDPRKEQIKRTKKIWSRIDYHGFCTHVRYWLLMMNVSPFLFFIFYFLWTSGLVPLFILQTHERLSKGTVEVIFSPQNLGTLSNNWSENSAGELCAGEHALHGVSARRTTYMELVRIF